MPRFRALLLIPSLALTLLCSAGLASILAQAGQGPSPRASALTDAPSAPVEAVAYEVPPRAEVPKHKKKKARALPPPVAPPTIPQAPASIEPSPIPAHSPEPADNSGKIAGALFTLAALIVAWSVVARYRLAKQIKGFAERAEAAAKALRAVA